VRFRLAAGLEFGGVGESDWVGYGFAAGFAKVGSWVGRGVVACVEDRNVLRC